MSPWNLADPLAIGGLVAIAFWDVSTVAVGSHSGLSLVDARTGATRGRVEDIDGTYDWYQADPPSVRRDGPAGLVLLPAMGLWGGALPTMTDDGWTAAPDEHGVVLSHVAGADVVLRDDDETRAYGFSPDSTVLAFATSATLHLVFRS